MSDLLHDAEVDAEVESTLKRAMASWRELGQTHFGALPIVIISLVTMFQVLEDQAFAFALPNIIRAGPKNSSAESTYGRRSFGCQERQSASVTRPDSLQWMFG